MTSLAAARTLLALVFLGAGLAKLRQGPAWFARVLDRFSSIPEGRTATVARAVIAGEIVAGILLATPAYAVGAVIGLVLAASFTWAVSTELLEGSRPRCGCLGGFRPMRVGAALLMIDLALAGLAAFTAWAAADPSSRGSWQAAGACAAGAVSVGGALQALLAWRRRRRRALPPGSLVPDVVALATSGREVRVRALSARALVVVFVDPLCRGCGDLLEAVAMERAVGLPVLTVVCGPMSEARALVQRTGGDPDWTVRGADARRMRARFGIGGMPVALLLAGGAVVSHQSPASPGLLRTLVTAAGSGG